MANITNFKPGETLTAEDLNQAFDLVGARADAVIGLAQGAKDDAAEALAKVEQSTERVPELIAKVEEIEEVIPNLATTASVTAAQAAAQSYADTVGVNTATTAKAYTDSQVETIGTQIETLSSELTAQSADIDEVTGALSSKADATAVYTKDETYTKSQVDALYDVIPYLSSGEVIARIKTPAGTKPLYAPQGSSGGSSVAVNAIVTTGTHIADLTVDGVVYELYAPEGGTGGVTIDEVIAEIEKHLAAYSTTAQVTASLELKADKDTTYTKAEVDSALSSKVNSSEVYTKGQVDSKLASKAPQDTTYTKTEVDALIAGAGGGGGGFTEIVETIVPSVTGSSWTWYVRLSTDLTGKCWLISVSYTGNRVDNQESKAYSATAIYDYIEHSLVITVPKDAAGSRVSVILQEIPGGTEGTIYWDLPGGSGGYTKSEIDTMMGNKLDSSVYYTYVNTRPVDKYLRISDPGIPSTAEDDFTVYALLDTDTSNSYEVTVVLDDPTLKFKSIAYDEANTRYAITFPKEVAGHTCRVHIQEVRA